MLLPFLWALSSVLSLPLSRGYTYEQDVFAINSLHASLGSPPLPGWIPNGGDPCTDKWQGVLCVGPNVTGIVLNGANLGGELGGNLINFSSMINIDLSNNRIGGSIPENLPTTMQQFFLSDNAFTGSIPSSLSTLASLTDMSLSHNMLSGVLPDSFQALTGLINLDLSFNNLSGPLPPSMESLSSLTTLHIQNNQFSGLLDVLQNLPLMNLNVENNLFSGPVPTKLYSIPNFLSGGNPFNSTVPPSSSPSPDSPSTPLKPRGSPPVPSISTSSNTTSSGRVTDRMKKLSTEKIIGIALAAVITAVILLLVAIFIVNYCISKRRNQELAHESTMKKQEMGQRETPRDSSFPPQFEIPRSPEAAQKVSAVPEERVEERKRENLVPVVVVEKRPTVEERRAPIERFELFPAPAQKLSTPTSVTSFSVGSLQQYTNSFSQENILRDSMLGRVYYAKLPDGKELAIMKLDNANNSLPVDSFFEIVLSISELRHKNILQLVGYCAEHGQRLLVYELFSRRSLHDVLHGDDDDFRRTLSWKARIQIALGIAMALEYLHDGHEPPVVHRDMESSNILLDDELSVRVCDCGLSSLLSSMSVTQLSGKIRSFSYEAPEVNDSSSYSEHSDIYSFGVVMLELLTGRKPYDSLRARGEQYLVRWASPQFHDIDMLTKMVDPFIEGRYPVKSLSRFADIISRCVQNAPEFRPPASEVVQDLLMMVEEMKRGNL